MNLTAELWLREKRQTVKDDFGFYTLAEIDSHVFCRQLNSHGKASENKNNERNHGNYRHQKRKGAHRRAVIENRYIENSGGNYCPDSYFHFTSYLKEQAS